MHGVPAHQCIVFSFAPASCSAAPLLCSTKTADAAVSPHVNPAGDSCMQIVWKSGSAALKHGPVST